MREVYGELYPAKPLPVAADLAHAIRTAIYPEDVVDLWRVMFPAGQSVSYDDEADVLRIRDYDSRYADRD